MSDADRPWPVYFGREMRGGLRRGHWHMAYVSRPVLKGPSAWIDCPACVEWAEELRLREAIPMDDVVARWNNMIKTQRWAMEPGEVYNWMDEAVEEIENLRRLDELRVRTMIPVAQLRAVIKQLFPDEMTPTAKRVLESICKQHEDILRSSSDKDAQV